MKIQKLYNEYKKAKAESDKLDELVNNGAYDLEREWDVAYNKEYQLLEALIDEIISVTGVDNKTARAMIRTDKFEQLMSLTVQE